MAPEPSAGSFSVDSSQPMTDFAWLDQRPIVVCIAGSNGAGKTTFFHAHLADCGLRYINADVLAERLELDPYVAAQMAESLRRSFLRRGESFVFETVFSDPAGDKLALLADAIELGFHVVVCFIGIANTETSEQRVSMRVTQGGHDVPDEKLRARFDRTIENLRRAIIRLPHVLVFDNDDLACPYGLVAEFESGSMIRSNRPLPAWLPNLLP